MTSVDDGPLPISVLFVCLGNICRSPMAEGVFRSRLSTAAPSSRYSLSQDRIDSAGTGAYHIGSIPDTRTLDVLNLHGINTYTHSARKVALKDFESFDYIFAMDSENLEDLLYERDRALKAKQKKDVAAGVDLLSASPRTRKTSKKGRTTNHLDDISYGKEPDGLANVMLFGAFGGKKPDEEVADPYYGSGNGFNTAYEQVSRFSEGFLDWLCNAPHGKAS